MRYISYKHHHSGREFLDVIRSSKVDSAERHWVLTSLLEIDCGDLAPNGFATGLAGERPIYFYQTPNPGRSHGIWTAFILDKDGVVLLKMAICSGSTVEHQANLSDAGRRLDSGTINDGGDIST